MSLLNDYINYFKIFAVDNLNHNPLSERPNADNKLSQSFAMFNADDITADLRSTMSNDVCLFLSLYDTQGSQNEYATQFWATCTGSVLIVKTADKNVVTERIAAMAECETVLYQLIQKMLSDAKGQGTSCHWLRKITFNSFNITPEENLFHGMYGYYAKFNFSVDKSEALKFDVLLP